MTGKWTNAAELGRLAGLSRERVGQLLAAGTFEGAVRVDIGERRAWRIPVGVASSWLKARGVRVLSWEKREDAVGAMDDCWIGVGLAVWVGTRWVVLDAPS